MFSRDDDLTLPHPLAHLRAFVMIPWLAIDPDAGLTVAGGQQSVAKLLAELDPADRAGVRLTEPDARRAETADRIGKLMGPTRKRDLTAAVVGTAVVGYLLVMLLYRWFPPITVWTGLSLLAVGIAEAVWARYVRAKISDGEIGDGPGWLHPLAVARSLMIAKASAWVGALALGWWVGVLVYFLPRRSWLRVAGEDTAGTAVAAVSALALVVAALWLQHCCKSPRDPTEHGEGAES